MSGRLFGCSPAPSTEASVRAAAAPMQLAFPLLLVTPHRAADRAGKSAEKIFESGVSNRPDLVPVPCRASEAQPAPVEGIDEKGNGSVDVTQGLTGAPDGSPSPNDVEMVVNLLNRVYQANERMAAELDRLTASRSSVSDADVQTFLRLADELRPGAAARARLAELNNDLQVAGAAEWIAQHRQQHPDAELVPTAAGPASRRALHRWHRRPNTPGDAA
jgi:hypothetical protein